MLRQIATETNSECSNIRGSADLSVESVVGHQVNILNTIAVVHLNVTTAMLQLVHLKQRNHR